MKQTNLKNRIKRGLALTLVVALTCCITPQTALAVSESQVKMAQDDYEAVSPQYRYDEQATAALPSSPSSRFVLEDGIYTNPEAKMTGQATLIITGDLMCQYFQQAAAFQSDGTDYLTYEEVKEITKAAQEKQDAAIKAAEEALAAAEEAAATAEASSKAAKETAAAQADQAAKAAKDATNVTRDAAEAAEPAAKAQAADKTTDETAKGDASGTAEAATPGTDKTSGADKTPGTDKTSGSDEETPPPSLPAASSVTAPPLDLGVIPQPGGTFDFTKSFQYVKDVFAQGDLIIGNLETMISQSSPLGMQVHRLEDKPYLNAPLSYLDALTYAGYDMLTMANNHNCDTGVRGILETLENVDNYLFMRTGLFSDEDEPRYLIADVNGIKIGFVAYATYFNQKEDNLTEAGQEAMLNPFSTEQAKKDIKAARAAGAEYIIAFIHWGAENTNDTTENQERNARALAKAGADYIVGSHPHALQHYDIIETPDERQVPVIYSMGNFVSNMNRDINNDTIILRLNLVKGENGEVALDSQRYYPCKVFKTLTTKDTDGKSTTDSYVVVPQIEKYMPDLDPSNPFDREILDQLKASGERILKVFGGRMVFPLPYDPYKIEEDDSGATMFYNLEKKLKYLKKNAA